MFLPTNLNVAKATALLSSGAAAYNSLLTVKTEANHSAHVAVIGTTNLAYLFIQYAKKVFKFEVTVFGEKGNEKFGEEFGVDHFEERTA